MPQARIEPPLANAALQRVMGAQLMRIEEAVQDKLRSVRDGFDEALRDQMGEWSRGIELLEQRVTEAEGRAAELEKEVEALRHMLDKEVQTEAQEVTHAVLAPLASLDNPPEATKEDLGLTTEPTEARPRSVAEWLRAQGLKVVDKRPSGGNLWVPGTQDVLARETLSLLSRWGFKFTYAPGGGRATGGRPGWYTKARG